MILLIYFYSSSVIQRHTATHNQTWIQSHVKIPVQRKKITFISGHIHQNHIQLKGIPEISLLNQNHVLKT